MEDPFLQWVISFAKLEIEFECFSLLAREQTFFLREVTTGYFGFGFFLLKGGKLQIWSPLDFWKFWLEAVSASWMENYGFHGIACLPLSISECQYRINLKIYQVIASA